MFLSLNNISFLYLTSRTLPKDLVSFTPINCAKVSKNFKLFNLALIIKSLLVLTHSFIRDNLNGRAIITIKNTYSNKNVDIENIFKKGISSKENHFGIGLWEVQKYVRKNQNIKLKTTKDEQYFKQELFIYDS